MYYRNCTFSENFKLKLGTCARSHALGTSTKFQFEILTITAILAVYFRKVILESSQSVSETTSMSLVLSWKLMVLRWLLSPTLPPYMSNRGQCIPFKLKYAIRGHIHSEYWIQHGAIGPVYVTSTYSIWIFCRGVSGFATDCPCGVWCRGLTTYLLHVGPPFGNRLLNKSCAVGLT